MERSTNHPKGPKTDIPGFFQYNLDKIEQSCKSIKRVRDRFKGNKEMYHNITDLLVSLETDIAEGKELLKDIKRDLNGYIPANKSTAR